MPRVGSTNGISGLFLGIDPGKEGGLAAIGPTGVQWEPMPDTELGMWRWFHEIPYLPYDRHAVIEHVHSTPQMGVTSAFTFGSGYGKLLMALTAAGISFEEVRPHVWQAALGIPPRRPHTKKKMVLNKKGKMVEKKYGGETDTQWKTRLLKKAQQLQPGLVIWNEAKWRQLSVADAILIAEFCRRKYNRA